MLSVILDDNLVLDNQKSLHYLIYKTINNINGKYYVGKHITDNVYDDYTGSGTLIKKAVSKYGLSAFTKVILYELSSLDDMNKMEAECVQLSNCFPVDPNSYNLKPGGSGGSLSGEYNPLYGTTFSDEHKANISKALTGRNLSEQHKLKLSNIHKNVSTWNTLSDEKKEEVSKKLSAALKGKKHNKEWNNKISNTLKARSVEQKQQTYEKFLSTLNNHTEEEKKQIQFNRSNAVKGRVINDTSKMKQASKAMWNDPNKKQHMLAKRAKKYALKTEEERRQINKKKGSGKNKLVLNWAIKALKKYGIDIQTLKLETFPFDEYKAISKDKRTCRLLILEKWLKSMNINIELVTTNIWVTDGKTNIKVSKNSIPSGFHVGLTQLKKDM